MPIMNPQFYIDLDRNDLRPSRKEHMENKMFSLKNPSERFLNPI